MWSVMENFSDIRHVRCFPDFGSGADVTVSASSFVPPHWTDNIGPFPAPLGVDPLKWAKLGRRAQAQIWMLANKLAIHQGWETGIAISIAFAQVELDALSSHNRVNHEAAILANKLIGSLESGRTAASLIINAELGSPENEAGALAYASCELFRSMSGPSGVLLSQDVLKGVRDITQGFAESHAAFTGYKNQAALTNAAVRGVLQAFHDDTGSCEGMVFWGKSPADFRFPDENLFVRRSHGGGGGGGGGISPEPTRSRP